MVNRRRFDVTTVRGPVGCERVCLVYRRTSDLMRVVLPTPGGPTTPTIIGGASSGRRSTSGTWNLFSLTCCHQYTAIYKASYAIHREISRLASAVYQERRMQMPLDLVHWSASSSPSAPYGRDAPAVPTCCDRFSATESRACERRKKKFIDSELSRERPWSRLAELRYGCRR